MEENTIYLIDNNNIRLKIRYLFEIYYNLKAVYQGPDKNTFKILPKNLEESKNDVISDAILTFDDMVRDFSLTENHYNESPKFKKKKNHDYEKNYLRTRKVTIIRWIFNKDYDFSEADYDFKFFQKEAPKYNYFNDPNRKQLFTVGQFLTNFISPEMFKKIIEEDTSMQLINKNYTYPLSKFITLITYSESDKDMRYYNVKFGKFNDVVISSIEKDENNNPFEIFKGVVNVITNNKLSIDVSSHNSVLRIIIIFNDANRQVNDYILGLSVGISIRNSQETVVGKKSILSIKKAKEIITNHKDKEVFGRFLNLHEIIRIGVNDLKAIKRTTNERYTLNLKSFINRIKEYSLKQKSFLENKNYFFDLEPSDLFFAPILNQFVQVTNNLPDDKVNLLKYRVNMSLKGALHSIVSDPGFLSFKDSKIKEFGLFRIDLSLDLSKYNSKIFFDTEDGIKDLFDTRIIFFYKFLVDLKDKSINPEISVTIIYDKEEQIREIIDVIPKGMEEVFYKIDYNKDYKALSNIFTIFCFIGEEFVLYKQLASSLLSLNVERSNSIQDEIRKSFGVIKKLREPLILNANDERV